MLNGYNMHAEQGEIVGLVIDTAEGQITVQDIAAKRKDWVSEFEWPDPEDW